MKIVIRIVTALLVCVLVVALLFFFVWWPLAFNYDANALAGTYVGTAKEVVCTLTLRKDGKFHEEFVVGGRTQTSDGAWDDGNGGVVFSNLIPPSPSMKPMTPNSLNYYGHFDKVLTVFPRLFLLGTPEGMTFHRKAFSNGLLKWN